ncbi:hypothetical protein PJL18_04409 [Paenarthrobacter nicotinovorans]|nr:hypothetical protein [Paenarthrobacter nicotinovorans]
MSSPQGRRLNRSTDTCIIASRARSHASSSSWTSLPRRAKPTSNAASRKSSLGARGQWFAFTASLMAKRASSGLSCCMAVQACNRNSLGRAVLPPCPAASAALRTISAMPASPVWRAHSAARAAGVSTRGIDVPAAFIMSEALMSSGSAICGVGPSV